MAEVLKDVKMYYRGFDLSGDMNNVMMTKSADIIDKTVFGSSFRKRKASLKSIELSGGGFWNSSAGAAPTALGYGKADPVLWRGVGSIPTTANWAGSSDLLSVVPRGTALGNVAYFTKGAAGEYAISGSIGEMLGFNFSAFSNAPLIRGQIASTGYMAVNLTTGGKIITLDTGVTTSLNLYMGVHCIDISSGQKLLVQTNLSTDVSDFAAATTDLSITLTTDDIGQGRWATTKVVNATSKQYIRMGIKNDGATSTSTRTARYVVVLAQQ